MILSEIAIRRPVFAWMTMIGLILFGLISFSHMGISLMPDIDFPVVSVSLSYAGASPEIMETDVVDIVEDAVMGIEGVRTVTSTSKDGSATVAIEFEINRNIDVAMQEVQSKLSQAQRLLPDNMDPPVISKSNPDDQPILWLTLFSKDMPVKDTMFYVNNYLKDKFSTVSGVGDVALAGYVDPSLRVWVRKNDLAGYALTVQDVISSIQNEHVELPAGTIDDARNQHVVRTLGEAKSVGQFESIRLNSRGGQANFSPIPLLRVATVEDGLADIQRISRSNGVFAVGLGIRKQRGSNAVAVAKAVRLRVAEIQKGLPKGMTLRIRVDNTKFIEDAVKELYLTLALAALLTGLVCWMFLGSWSATLNVWLAIPTSIVGAFTVLYFLGFTLNTFTLMALSLAIGLVVDDAIMVLENIMRHQEKGEDKVQAALAGSREITFAVLAASIAIVAIFLPVAFMKGIIGKYFYQFGVTISVAVMLSLFEALTLTPMRCAQFVTVGTRNSRLGRGITDWFKNLTAGYRRNLAWVLDHRAWIVWAAVLFFILTIQVSRILRTEFVPAQDQSLYVIRLLTPAGSALAFTDAKAKAIETILLKRPEISGCFTTVGGFGGGSNPNSAILFITMKPKGQRGLDAQKKRALSQMESMSAVRKILKKVPDLKVSIQDLSMRGFSAGNSFPIQFTVRGQDWAKMGEYSAQIMKALEETGLMTDIGTDYLVGMTEYDVVPDRQLAAQRGVSMFAIGQTLQVLVGGAKAGTYERNGHRYDITVKMTGDKHKKFDIMNNVYLRNNRGELIALSSVARLVEKPALLSITRNDRERAITIYGNVAAGKSQSAVLAAIERITKNILPTGYHIVLSGNTQASKESFESLLGALLLGIIISYMVLASQFNSYVDPVLILAALPFSISGAFIALYLFNQSLNIYSMIGFILLMGIVKKNSILLVEFTNQMREKGLNIREALLEACPIRLRPIIMTSLATVAGAVPAALALGPGAETRMPMAIAVIGGVIVSTLLTLFVIPCLYSLFGHRRQREKE